MSRPAIRIATIGVAVGLAVMIVTVSVIFGFKHTIRDKVVGFGSHIQIQNFTTQQTSIPMPACISDSLVTILRRVPNVRHVERYAIYNWDSDWYRWMISKDDGWVTPAGQVYRDNRSTFAYKATHDHYQLKLQHIFQAFLSPNHVGLCSISFVKTPQTKTLCCKIDVKKCAEDDFVYCSVKYAADRPAVDEIFVRIGNEKKPLQGRARDEFVEKRVKAGFDSQLKTLRDSMSMAGTQGTNAVLASVRELLAKIDGQHIPGAAITVSGGQPFTEASVTAAKKPKSLAWEGQHYAEVSGWQDLVLKVFEKLQEIDAAKFDALAGQKEFKKYLVTIHKPKEKHPECYAAKFGAEGKVKIKKSLGNKVYLWQEDKALRKIIATFGVDVSKFMFVAG